MCPSKHGITFYLHLHVFITIRAKTLDNRHQCGLILPIIHQYGRYTAHQQYVRILRMLHQRMSEYYACLVNLSMSVAHTTIHLSMAA